MLIVSIEINYSLRFLLFSFVVDIFRNLFVDERFFFVIVFDLDVGDNGVLIYLIIL